MTEWYWIQPVKSSGVRIPFSAWSVTMREQELEHFSLGQLLEQLIKGAEITLLLRRHRDKPMHGVFFNNIETLAYQSA
ncbi:hypothetical protein GO639_03350 [Staphylococcus aureus]|nr:hypothetical protein [Staphylococcus aureus]